MSQTKNEKSYGDYEREKTKLKPKVVIDVDPIPEAQTESKTEEHTEKSKSLAIPIGKNGLVQARDNAELMRYCGAMIAGGGVPERFNTPQKLFAALM